MFLSCRFVAYEWFLDLFVFQVELVFCISTFSLFCIIFSCFCLCVKFMCWSLCLLLFYFGISLVLVLLVLFCLLCFLPSCFQFFHGLVCLYCPHFSLVLCHGFVYWGLSAALSSVCLLVFLSLGFLVCAAGSIQFCETSVIGNKAEVKFNPVCGFTSSWPWQNASDHQTIFYQTKIR